MKPRSIATRPQCPGNDPDFGTGRDEFKVNWRERITAFPDLHFEITDMIAEGDQVLTRWVMTGTHQGEYLGAQPTGIKVRVEGMSLEHDQGRCGRGRLRWLGCPRFPSTTGFDSSRLTSLTDRLLTHQSRSIDGHNRDA